jgi:hypothetical protein
MAARNSEKASLSECDDIKRICGIYHIFFIVKFPFLSHIKISDNWVCHAFDGV